MLVFRAYSHALALLPSLYAYTLLHAAEAAPICRDAVRCPNIVQSRTAGAGAGGSSASAVPPSDSGAAVGQSSTFAERALSLNTLILLPCLILLLYVYYVMNKRLERRRTGTHIDRLCAGDKKE